EETGREVVFLPVPRDLVSAQPSREELRRAEAKTVAAFLKQAIPYAGLAIWGERAVQYRDIAVLFRTHQAMAAYEEALQSVGVPYRVYGGRRYANRQEVEELRALLRAIDSPSDTVALVATLRSSLFGFTDEELALWVSTGGRFDYLTAAVPAGLPVADRFTLAFALLRDLHTRRAQVSPGTLLYEIYDRTHLLPLFALRPQGTQCVANLLKLIDTARTLATRGLNTLTALTRFLEQQEYIAEEGEPPITEDQDDALHLFTIHKAKGLEFSVVILADAVSTGSRASRTGIIERIGGSLELQIGPRALTCTTQGWQKAEAREQARDAAEERRLWYVAAARVRDHLIIPVLPRVETRAQVRQWTLADESPFPCESVSPLHQVGSGRAFVYHSHVDTVGQTAPIAPVAAQFTNIAPDETVVRTYQEWETRRRAVLAKGRRTDDGAKQ
ncbi:MAG: 3'-5' exonuclease, partial [Candidatus Binatia bacterium]